MYRKFAIAAIAVLIAGPALASGCSTAPSAKLKPKSQLSAKLKAEGLTVRQIKVEGGCYEVYALDKHGKRVNAAYNAETFQKLANAEAGER